MPPDNDDLSFLDNVPGLSDDTSTTTTTSPDNTGNDPGTGSSQQTDTGSTTNNTGTTQQPGTQRQQQQRNPSPQDLLDPATGQVVARAGAERRFYESAQRATRQATELQAKLSAAEGRLAGYTEAHGLAQQLNLTPQDQMVAMQMLAGFRNNPAETLKAIITDMKSKGHQLPFLEQAGGLDMGALTRLIDDKLKPFTDARQQSAQQVQAQERARQDLDGFLGVYPDAQQNLDIIARVMQGQGLGLHDAYIRLIHWAGDNGLDWRQPLGPQIQARQASTGAQPSTTSRPLPGVRSATGGAAGNQAAARVFEADADYGDIVRSALAEAGIQ